MSVFFFFFLAVNKNNDKKETKVKFKKVISLGYQ